jgi:hypothetical protein
LSSHFVMNPILGRVLKNLRRKKSLSALPTPYIVSCRKLLSYSQKQYLHARKSTICTNITKKFKSWHYFSTQKPGSENDNNETSRDKVITKRNNSTGYLLAALVILFLGLSYLAVPLYRMFCQATGYGGTTRRHEGGVEALKEKQVPEKENRPILICFNSDVG